MNCIKKEEHLNFNTAFEGNIRDFSVCTWLPNICLLNKLLHKKHLRECLALCKHSMNSHHHCLHVYDDSSIKGLSILASLPCWACVLSPYCYVFPLNFSAVNSWLKRSMCPLTFKFGQFLKDFFSKKFRRQKNFITFWVAILFGG